MVDLVDCRSIVLADSAAACCDVDPSSEYAWILSNARPITNLPVRGRLGVFEVAIPELVAEVELRKTENPQAIAFGPARSAT
jgi:hypothetical protein